MMWLILILSFLIKLPFCGKPMVGYFGSYQAINAMMGQMMVHGPWQNFLAPRTFVLFNGEPSFHLIYYPLGAFFAALLKLLMGGDLVFWGHFQSAVFMAASGLIFYDLVLKIHGKEIARTALLVFCFLPMNLAMGISLQNESVALFFLLAATRLVLSAGVLSAFMAGILFSVALTARLHFLSLLPLFFYFWFSEKKKPYHFFLFLMGVIIPVALCFGYFYTVEQAQPSAVMTSLFMQSKEGRILAQPWILQKAFYGRLYEILAGNWVTPILLPFVLLGMPSLSKRGAVWGVWLCSAAAVILILPQKVYDHPFYLIGTLPAAAALIALGYEMIKPQLSKTIRLLFWLVFLGLSMRYYVPVAFSGGADKELIPRIGRTVQQIAGPQDYIIASHGSSPDLLYYCNRLGWGFDLNMRREAYAQSAILRQQKAYQEGYGDLVVWLEKLRSDGGRYFVVSEPNTFRSKEFFYRYVSKHYKELSVPSEKFYIFDLKEKA